MEKMSKNTRMQKWWEETSFCQIPLHGNSGNNAWSAMEMLFIRHKLNGFPSVQKPPTISA